MLKKLIFLSSLALVSLSSKEYFSLDAGLGVGYRQDQYKTVFHDPLNPDDLGLTLPVLTERGDHIRSVALEGFLKIFIMKYIFLRFDADYAWPQTGKIHERPVVVFGPNLNLAFPTSTNIDGNALYDVLGAGGLAFNLLPSSINQKLLVIPQGGYSLHYQKITKERKAPTTEFFPAAGFDIIFDQNLNLSTLRTTWKGPFVGGDISTDPNKCFYAEVGYLFHFLTLNYKTNFFDEGTAPFGLVTFAAFWNGEVKNAYAHQARGRVAYCFTDHWKIGLSGNYYFLNGGKDKTINFSSSSVFNGVITLASRPMKFTHRAHFYSIFLDLIFHY